jgi:hypothetical protein
LEMMFHPSSGLKITSRRWLKRTHFIRKQLIRFLSDGAHTQHTTTGTALTDTEDAYVIHAQFPSSERTLSRTAPQTEIQNIGTPLGMRRKKIWGNVIASKFSLYFRMLFSWQWNRLSQIVVT